MQDLESREKREERWWMTYGLAYREREREEFLEKLN